MSCSPPTWSIGKRGTTVAPLEISESLHTLHDGIITAGFLFALLAVAGTLVFGRFFCGWGCHILALQDGCAWLLGRLGIRPKPVRSRTMVLIPLGIMAYIYAWPQLVRVWEGRAYPGLRVVQAVDGWGSFMTRDLFRAMPGPFFSILTLAVCGGAIVYFLGARSFCYSVCPYGVFFGWAERFDFTGREEALFLVSFLAVFLVYRGLYEIGIFLAAALGVIAGAETIRWLRTRNAKAAADARTRKGGAALRRGAAALRLAFLALTVHGAYVHYHSYAGQRAYDRDPAGLEGTAHLHTASARALFPQPAVERSLALAAAGQGDFGTARGAFARFLALRPRDVVMRVQYAALLANNGQGEASERELRAALLPDAQLASAEERPWRATAHSLLAQRRAAAGDTAEAGALLALAMADDPWDASHACNLAFLRIRQGQIPEARKILDGALGRLGRQPCLEQLSQLAGAASP